MKKNIKRLVIEIDQRQKSFDISTPDGSVEYSTLLDIISTIMQILVENKPKKKRRVSKKDLN